METTAWISLVGALGLGSVLGQWVAGTRDHRSARARVLEALGVVEQARWAPWGADKPTFRDASKSLQSAALVAQIPREPVRAYLEIAQAACWLSRDKYEEDIANGYQDDHSGGINGQLADGVRAAAAAIAELLWAPWWRRRFGTGDIAAEINQLADQAAANDRAVASHLERSRAQGI